MSGINGICSKCGEFADLNTEIKHKGLHRITVLKICWHCAKKLFETFFKDKGIYL